MPVVPPDPFAGEGVAAAVPAATVVPLRDGPDGLETLLLLRATKLSFAGGMWVWPGGRIDPADEDRAAGAGFGLGEGVPVDEDDAMAEATARHAAVREAAEEAGLVLSASELVWFSHWTPPAVNAKRFRTWFFAVAVPGDVDVVVDGGEILDHRWLRPVEAMAARDAGDLELSPPTFITLAELARYGTVARALDDLGRRRPTFFATRFATVPGGAVALYAGDAGYQDEDADRPGGRNRLWMLDEGWRYERSATT